MNKPPQRRPEEHRAERLLALLGRFEAGMTFLAFVVMVGAIFIDVATRELTGVGIAWARQTGVYANIVVVMLGIGIASSRAAHLRPRFADHWLPAHWQARLGFAGDALMALFFAILAGLAAHVTVESFQLAERSTVIGVPVWPVMAVMPLAFSLVALRHALYARYPALRPADPLPARGDTAAVKRP